MKETKILKNNQVHAQSFKQTEQALANLTNANLKTLSEALADKDKIISELEYKIDSLEEVSKTSLGIINSLEKQNKDLDYLLNSGRNKFEQGRIERLKELEEALASQQEVYQASLWIKNSSLEANFTQLEEPAIKQLEPIANLTKITGQLTSNLRSRISSNTPWMAFFRKDRKCQEHTIEECQRTKCQNCEIPVIFRIKSSEIIHKNCWTKGNCNDCQKEQVKPQLKKGDKVILEGEFNSSKDSNRPSFTCYSYQILSSERIERTKDSSDQVISHGK